MESSSPSIVDATTLLQHASFLRSLALRLVRDESEADDVVQDSWLRALRRPPRDTGSPRAWLAKVVSSVASERRRSAGRRSRHERAAADPEAVAPAAPREEQLDRLVQAVRTLEQPYRRTILERYFEGLTPARIAERHGVPATTVYSWIRRAHERLRERLDAQEQGDRQRWVRGLCTALGLEPGDVAAASTGLGVGAQLALAGIGGCLVIATLLWWQEARSREVVRPEPGALDSSVVTADDTVPQDAPPRIREETTADPRPPTEAGSSQDPASTVPDERGRVVGRVFGPDGRPRAGVTLVFTGGRMVKSNGEPFPSAVSDASGQFERLLQPGQYRLVAEDPVDGGNVVEILYVEAARDLEHDVHLCPPLSGRIVDGEGEPRPGLRVEARYVQPGWIDSPETVSDEDGRFTLAPLPDLPVDLVVLANDAERSAPPLWMQSVRARVEPWIVVLDPAAVAPGTIRGRFLGLPRPLEDAEIGLWYGEHAVDVRGVAADGSFLLESIPPRFYELELSGAGPEWAFAKLELAPGEDLDLGEIAVPEPLRLRVDFDLEGLPAADTLQASVSLGGSWRTSFGTFSQPQEMESTELRPGEYAVALWRRSFGLDDDGFLALTRVEVKDQPVDVRLPHADSIGFTIEFATDGDVPQFLVLHLADADGAPLATVQIPRANGQPTRAQLLLDAGRYALRLESAEGKVLVEEALEVNANTRQTTIRLGDASR